MSDWKIGDRIKIKDGSYAVRVDKYDPHCGIGNCKDDFEIISLTHRDWLKSSPGCSTEIVIHDVFIKNTITGAIYLHSLALCQKACCPTCGR